MLKDDTMNLSQKILVDQFSLDRGFEDTTLPVQTFTQVPGKFLQIVHVPENHWVLISRGKFQEINLYDSLKTTKSYPKKVLKTVARIASCSQQTLQINVMPTQQQRNSIDCGVFAITNAVELLSSGDSVIESLSYEPSLMRNHLLTCIQLEEFSPFPKNVKTGSSMQGLYVDFRCFLHLQRSIF